MNFVALTTIADQTVIITPRFDGQVVRLGAQEIVTVALTPVRIFGTGTVELSEGFWDDCGVFDGRYDGPQFDGRTQAANGYRFYWQGTADASPSVMFQVLKPMPDMTPVPRILVDVTPDQFPAGAVTVSLTRTAEGRTFDVRGGVRLPAGFPAVVTDAEAPFGVESSYTVVGYDVDGNVVGSWPVGSVTLEFDGVVVQQPLDPRLSVVVERLWETGRSLVRSTPFSLAYPQGRVLPGLVGLGPRRGLEGVEWELVTADAADADKLQATLGTYDAPQLPIWLIRTPPDMRVPRVFFCSVALTELDTLRLTSSPGVHFRAVTTEVRPPAVGVTAAVLTHSDMKVFFSTHSQVKAQYATHSDIKRDTSLIGAADA